MNFVHNPIFAHFLPFPVTVGFVSNHFPFGPHRPAVRMILDRKAVNNLRLLLLDAV